MQSSLFRDFYQIPRKRATIVAIIGVGLGRWARVKILRPVYMGIKGPAPEFSLAKAEPKSLSAYGALCRARESALKAIVLSTSSPSRFIDCRLRWSWPKQRKSAVGN